MVIDLKSIFVNENSSLPIEYEKMFSDFDYMGNYPLKKPVRISGNIFNKASLVMLDAVIYYEFDAPCDRCGINAAKGFSIPVKKSLAVSIEGEDSDSILLVPDMKLDVDELVYAEVVVSLPMKHLCREDCRGICPKCGKDLNEGNCDCPVKEIDSRLSALADLLNN